MTDVAVTAVDESVDEFRLRARAWLAANATASVARRERTSFDRCISVLACGVLTKWAAILAGRAPRSAPCGAGCAP